ncbi:hypothetical protein HGB24_02465 [Candidatus Saccharibacteria bacterium]|nr:hypothetical protein [Candidatus Saccharibacteria bacterium]
MIKIDYKKDMRNLYSGKVGEVVTVEVPEMNYLMIDGHGDPNTSKEFADALQTLYPLAYTIKFDCKKNLDNDFAVMPLEGLWWADDMNDFLYAKKDNWSWTVMIAQPDFVTKDIVSRSIEAVTKKKSPPLIDKVRFESYAEGRSAQVMYVGAYSDEGPTIAKMHEYIKSSGGKLDGKSKYHHEIYLSDQRRTDPSKLKTIIRQPY